MSKDKWFDNSRQQKIGTRPIKGNDLIICGGVQTEKNYFEKATIWFVAEAKIKKDVAKFFVECDAQDPLNMAKNAPKIKKRVEQEHRITIDNVWVVFDKDDFGNSDFNTAIEIIDKKKGYKALWSNECFELWFLLHFGYMDAAISREQYYKRLTKCFGERYDKTDSIIFSKLTRKGTALPDAIRNAKSLKRNVPPASNNPMTTVYEFFLFYSKYLGIFEEAVAEL